MNMQNNVCVGPVSEEWDSKNLHYLIYAEKQTVTVDPNCPLLKYLLQNSVF